MQRFLVIYFKISLVLVIAINLLLRLASEHRFILPIEEKLAYLVMIITIILVSLLPRIGREWQRAVKYLTVLFLSFVLAIGVYFSITSFDVDYEDGMVAILFHGWDLALPIVTGYVLFLVFTDKLTKRKAQTN